MVLSRLILRHSSLPFALTRISRHWVWIDVDGQAIRETFSLEAILEQIIEHCNLISGRVLIQSVEKAEDFCVLTLRFLSRKLSVDDIWSRFFRNLPMCRAL